MMRRRSVAYRLLLALLPACCGAAPLTVTILTDNGYPPYSYEASGQAIGIYNDILRAASTQLRDYRIELRPVPWKRGLAELESGRALALSPPYYRPRERPYMQPYSAPMLNEQVVAYCRAAVMRQPRPRWPDDYLGLRFGSNAGFRPGGDLFWQRVGQGRIALEEAADVRTNLLKAIRAHLDCYLNDRLAIRQELARLQWQGLYSPGTLVEAAVVSEEQGFVGFTDRDSGRFPYKQDFIRQLNQALAEMKRSGQIDRIVEQALQTGRPPATPPF
ncbi:ABC transporter substrate-binding protein [Chromobacterium sp. ATCC 53434]|uniref:substrate-binding periplasmic protein n=1 Tax=Chromobacterium sp. (strain ATCC 53434 / SC 14030) TaxID=2059672 RepID=UPI000C769D9D|nr:transporter substrate-binding domain-containing protein [Chromobacterium sp. ATCC 53434]AUH53202.1 ABC transporter substrate-binding protein [Chromobacterium sp. ATCC 53434]